MNYLVIVTVIVTISVIVCLVSCLTINIKTIKETIMGSDVTINTDIQTL